MALILSILVSIAPEEKEGKLSKDYSRFQISIFKAVMGDPTLRAIRLICIARVRGAICLKSNSLSYDSGLVSSLEPQLP